MKNNMIFEFIGLPGSGKTTISRELIKELKSEGINVKNGYYTNSSRVIRFAKKIFSIKSYFFKSPRNFINVTRFCLKCHNYRFASYKDIVEILFLLNRYHIANNSNKIWIFDQGLLQATISLKLFVNEETNIIEFISGNIENVIYVKSEIILTKERLILRNDFSSRIQRNGVDIDELKLAEKIIAEIISTKKQNIFTVENNSTLDSPVLKIKEWIKENI